MKKGMYKPKQENIIKLKKAIKTLKNGRREN